LSNGYDILSNGLNPCFSKKLEYAPRSSVEAQQKTEQHFGTLEAIFMIRLTLLIGALLLFAGCPDFEEVNETESSKLICDDAGCVICENMTCYTYACSATSQCPSGYACSAAGSCMPAANNNATTGTKGGGNNTTAQCGHTSHCATGQVCENKICVDKNGTTSSGDTCTLSSQCKKGEVCLDGECRTPETNTTEAGPDCNAHTDCDSGQECKKGECAQKSFPLRPEGTCQFNLDCGPTGTCVNSRCYFPPTKSGCPDGAEAVSGLCMPIASANECSLNTDCESAELCINATCKTTCAKDEQCSHGTYCGDKGLCALDDRPILQCLANADCQDTLSCVDGRCLEGCVEDSKTDAPICEQSENVCQFGYCMPKASCFVAADCGAKSNCVDGQCAVSSGNTPDKPVAPGDDDTKPEDASGPDDGNDDNPESDDNPSSDDEGDNPEDKPGDDDPAECPKQ